MCDHHVMTSVVIICEYERLCPMLYDLMPCLSASMGMCAPISYDYLLLVSANVKLLNPTDVLYRCEKLFVFVLTCK